jgi:cell division septation protein DedD
MRWIFLLLLTANIAYVAWELNQPGTHERQLVPEDPAVPKLVLLSELPQAAPASPDATTTATQGEAEQKTTSPVQAEAENNQKTEKVEVPPPAQPEPKQPVQPSFACYTLGPFRDIADLRKLTRDIHDYVVEASFRSHDEQEQSMYWVYLPRQKNHEAANALADRLKSKKIRDYYVVPKGDQANAISLGHFKEKERAQSLQKKVKAAGFPALMEPVFKTYTIYWLDYRVQTNRTIPSSALDLSNMPGVSRLDRDCK